jgi:hypothetical protein
MDSSVLSSFHSQITFSCRWREREGGREGKRGREGWRERGRRKGDNNYYWRV